MIIQRCQNKFLRLITNAYRYVTDEELHNDFEIKWALKVIQDFDLKHERRLFIHTNVDAVHLYNTQEIRRLMAPNHTISCE
ncbi:hypothetical protein HHI36_010243, partial [Cryptolaemus montrouzieri]